jgi:hypothetical protein
VKHSYGAYLFVLAHRKLCGDWEGITHITKGVT